MNFPSQVSDVKSIAASARRLGDEIGGEHKEPLHIIGEFLDNTGKLIETLPMVMERARIEATLSAFQECALMIRGMADDIEHGRQAPLRPHAALRKAAAAIERAVANNRPEPALKPKAGLILQ